MHEPVALFRGYRRTMPFDWLRDDVEPERAEYRPIGTAGRMFLLASLFLVAGILLAAGTAR